MSKTDKYIPAFGHHMLTPLYDRVLCSLVLHHLTTENKQSTLKEVYRVLRSGGELPVADFGKPGNFPAYLIPLIIRLFEDVMDNIKGLLPEMFARAGFSQVEETARYMTIAGTLALYKARKVG